MFEAGCGEALNETEMKVEEVPGIFAEALRRNPINIITSILNETVRTPCELMLFHRVIT